jgi:hypothetical protein
LPPFQLGLVFPQLVFEIAPNRFGVRRPNQVGAHGFNRALVGRYAQQHIQLVVRCTRIAICLQWQMLGQHAVRTLQHFLIRQFQSIIRHGLALLELLGCANNHTRFGQASLVKPTGLS